MPLTLTGGAVLATDNAFQKRVALGFYFIAQEVYSENSNTPFHELRQRFAKSIIVSEFADFQKLSAVVATNSQIVQQLNGDSPSQSSVPDAMILTVIRQIWNPLAGVQ